MIKIQNPDLLDSKKRLKSHKTVREESLGRERVNEMWVFIKQKTFQGLSNVCHKTKTKKKQKKNNVRESRKEEVTDALSLSLSGFCKGFRFGERCLCFFSG